MFCVGISHEPTSLWGSHSFAEQALEEESIADVKGKAAETLEWASLPATHQAPCARTKYISKSKQAGRPAL